MEPAGLEPRETLRIGIGIVPDTFELAQVNNTAVANLLENVVETLVRVDENGEIVPHLATSWKISGDGREFTFQLPEGVTFHDGTSLDAKAVIWNADRLQERAALVAGCPVAAELAALQRVEEIDASTVRYTLSRPVPNFLANLSWVAWAILSPRSENLPGNKRFDIQRPVGTGPYAFSALTKDQLQLNRFDGYRGGRTYFSELAYKFISSSQEREAGLANGQLDVNLLPSVKQIPSLARNARMAVYTRPGSRSIFVNLHNQKPPFNDVRVRRAVNLAIDKQALIDEVLLGAATVLDAPVPPGIFGYCRVGSYDYDPAAAKALLAEAKVAPGTRLRLLTPRGRYLEDEAVAQRIGGYLRDVGFEVVVQALEWPALMGEISRPPEQVTADMHIFGWAPTFPDAGWQLPHFYASKNWPPFGPAGSFYKNPEVDKLLEAASREADPATRKNLFCEAEQRIWADAPSIFLWVQNFYVTSKAGLANIVSLPSEKVSVAFARPADSGAVKRPGEQPQSLISHGNVTIYVSNMDRAVEFYTGTLGLKLENRYGDEWASVDAGGGLMLGLHPARFPQKKGAKRAAGSIEIGFQVEQPLEQVVAELRRRGVELHDIPEDPEAAIRLVRFRDPDGNGLYLFAPW